MLVPASCRRSWRSRIAHPGSGSCSIWRVASARSSTHLRGARCSCRRPLFPMSTCSRARLSSPVYDGPRGPRCARWTELVSAPEANLCPVKRAVEHKRRLSPARRGATTMWRLGNPCLRAIVHIMIGTSRLGYPSGGSSLAARTASQSRIALGGSAYEGKRDRCFFVRLRHPWYDRHMAEPPPSAGPSSWLERGVSSRTDRQRWRSCALPLSDRRRFTRRSSTSSRLSCGPDKNQVQLEVAPCPN